MKRAFTLIELLVVVLIVGVLSSLAMIQYRRAVNRSRAAEVRIAVKAIREALSIYYLANGEYPADLSELDLSIGDTGNISVGTDQKPGFALTNWNIIGQSASIGSGTNVSTKLVGFQLRGKNMDAIVSIDLDAEGPYPCVGTNCEDIAAERVSVYHEQTSS